MKTIQFASVVLTLVILLAVVTMAIYSVSGHSIISYLDVVTGENIVCWEWPNGRRLCLHDHTSMYASYDIDFERYEDGSAQWTITYCERGGLCDDNVINAIGGYRVAYGSK